MRKFEPPYTIEPFGTDPRDLAFIIRDGSGTALAYVYGVDRASGDLHKLSVEEARGVARALVLGLEKVSASRRGQGDEG